MERTFSFGEHTSTVEMYARDRLSDGIGEGSFHVADSRTAQYLPPSATAFRLPPGEAAKSWDDLHQILSAMLAADLTRDATVVGVGGGVVCDVTALAASLYLRGCRLVLIPTTLLAMVDAAIGGKTGINFGGYKNIVGTFYPANEVRICPETLATLPEREYRSGLAEAIKTALLGDERLLATLENEYPRVLDRDDELLEELVWACVMVKGSIVETDLTETGVRAYLNLGHTFAHALESVQGLGSWSHGEAVAWGIAQAMVLGVAAGITDASYAERVRDLLFRYGYRIDPLPDSAGVIRAAMQKDKKRRGSRLRFVLQERVGQTVVTEVDADLLDAVLAGRS
jgi:3-dehydroquinate synthase